MDEQRPWRVLYFGTSDESLPGARALMMDARFLLVGVVTQPPRPVGRKRILSTSPLQNWAEEHGIPVLAPTRASSALELIEKQHADVHVVVSYGQILSDDLVHLPPKGTINVHPSLLPLHRGATPVPSAILSGDDETGVVIMKMDQKMDHGPLLYTSEPVEIGKQSGGSLLMRLMEIGACHLPDVLAEYLAGKREPQAQDHARATFCSLLSREDARVHWSKGPEYIDRMIRAYDPWPGAWTEVEFKDGIWRRLKIMRAHIDPELDRENKGFCTNGRITHVGQLVVDAFQLAGKAEMTGEDFAKTQPAYCRPLR